MAKGLKPNADWVPTAGAVGFAEGAGTDPGLGVWQAGHSNIVPKFSQ